MRGWLDALAVRHERRGFAGSCPLGSIVAEVADYDERLRVLAAEAFARWERELAASLESLKERGGLRPESDPAVLAEEVLAAMQGGTSCRR